MGDPVLYHGQPNGPSLSVLAALAESGLAVECQLIDLATGERHPLLRDPALVSDPLAADFAVEGEGPVLVVDGEAMSEAVFIAEYFDEAAGGGGLQPRDPYARWQMRMWCRQATERLAPAAACLGTLALAGEALARMDDGTFAELEAQIVSEDLRERWRDLRSGARDEAKLTDSRAKIAQFAERIDAQLADGREWLMGDFSIADLETFGWLRSMRTLEPAAFEGQARCVAWLDRMEARPCVQAALARATEADPAQCFAPGPEINRWG